MSKARGLISGGDYESRTSGMYDSVDNIRIAAISQAGLKKVGMEQLPILTGAPGIPNAFAWSPDGHHLYITYSGDYVIHYELSTAWDTSTRNTQATWDCRGYESNTQALEVSPDGRYLYIGGTDRDGVSQFTMNTAWTIAEYTTDNIFNPGYEQLNKRLDDIRVIGSSDPGLTGITFNNNGMKMYLIGTSDENVQQFSLTDPYLIGGASYEGYYNVDHEHGDYLKYPTSIRWNNDGMKFFVTDYGQDKVVEYSVSNPWDVITENTVTKVADYSVSSKETYPWDVAFNTDGTKMFVVGSSSDKIHEWTLSEAFDLSSNVTYISGTSLELDTIRGFDFNPDGTKLVVVCANLDAIRAYDLSTGFDPSTILNTNGYETIVTDLVEWVSLPSTSSAENYSLTNWIGDPTSCRFNDDGTTITILDRYNNTNFDRAISFPLTEAYELSNLSDGTLDSKVRGVSSPSTIRFNPDGTKCYILDTDDDKIYQWSLYKPYVLGRGSIASTYDGVSSSLTDSDGVMRSFDFAPDGKAIFTCGSYTDSIAHYKVSIPFNVTSPSLLTLVEVIDTSLFEDDPKEIRVVKKPDGYKLHLLGSGSYKIHEFDINF